MGMLGKLFGSEKSIDAGIGMIDKAFYTQEEKAEDTNKRMNLKAALLAAYVPFKIAQRLLALIYGIPYVLAWSATFAASFFTNVDTQMSILTNSDMATANLVILGFYFCGGAAESIFKYRVTSGGKK